MESITFIKVVEIILCFLVFCFGVYAFINLIINRFSIYMSVFCLFSVFLSINWFYLIIYCIVDNTWYTPNRSTDIVVTLNIIQTLLLLLYALVSIIFYINNRKIINK